jgi:predicted O-linked N-acetylglucosamine transferase (SPINDLY family)
MRGRVTLALYRKLGVLDCVADSSDRYVELALRIACDAEFREDLRRRVLAANAVLFEEQVAVAQIAAFLEQAVQQSIEAQAPG